MYALGKAVADGEPFFGLDVTKENVYYIDYKGNPVVLPAPLQQALDQPVKSYRDYHILFLSLGLAVAVGYAGWTVYGWRRTRR